MPFSCFSKQTKKPPSKCAREWGKSKSLTHPLTHATALSLSQCYVIIIIVLLLFGKHKKVESSVHFVCAATLNKFMAFNDMLLSHGEAKWLQACDLADEWTIIIRSCNILIVERFYVDKKSTIICLFFDVLFELRSLGWLRWEFLMISTNFSSKNAQIYH